MRTDLKKACRELGACTDHHSQLQPKRARVGVNTGEVVVRSITTGAGQTEYTPIGHTTNLASRMQAVAPTGSIAISEQTRRFVEGYFQLKPLDPTKVKGVAEPVNVYEVTGLGPLRTRRQRAEGRGLTKFVRREREMEALRAAADRATSGHGQLVAAMAEAEVGKSRMYFEFKVKNQSGWMVLETFSVSHGKASPYLPVIARACGEGRASANEWTLRPDLPSQRNYRLRPPARRKRESGAKLVSVANSSKQPSEPEKLPAYKAFSENSLV